MSVVNLREKTILAKVVYYGPPLGGKTTSLQCVHRVMDPERRTNLISLNTDQDRTLFFDFLPINLGRIGDFSLKIQGFTVPGQVKYLLTRRYVLRGADAIVFVADSRRSQKASNEASLRDLQENLERNGLTLKAVPLVFEYNKRDEEGLLTVPELDASLNPDRVPAFETIATRGDGVFEAFIAGVEAMVARICREYRIGEGEHAASGVRSTLERILVTNRDRAAEDLPADAKVPAAQRGASVVIVNDPDAADPAAAAEQLLERALGTQVQVAELLSEVQEARSSLEARVNELSTLYRVAGAAAAELDEDRVVAAVAEGASQALRLRHASILLRDEEDGAVRERGVHGFLYDPLVSGSAAAGGTSPLSLLLQSKKPVLITEDQPPGVLEAIRGQEAAVHSAIAAPLRIRDEAQGLLVVYYVGSGTAPGPTAVRFLGALAASASIALENARLHGTLERFNRELEAKVEDRTRELQAANEELKKLDQLKDDFLSTMSHELMTPLAGIRSSAEILRSYADLGPVERQEFVGGIEQEAARLSDRLQDILDLSALDAGKARFAFAPVVPRELVSDAVQRVRPRGEARNVRINIWPQTGLPKIRCDRRWMDRALDHVLDNAIRYSPANAEVGVTVEADGDAVKISVRDRGPGIPVDQRESLFRRFKQLGSVLTDKAPGIGAGLPLARRVVEGHGGTLGIDGGPGRGTVLWMRLPVA